MNYYYEDCINRQAAFDLVADYDLSMGQDVKGIHIHALPSVTLNEDKFTLTTATTATSILFALDSKDYYTLTTVLPYEEHKHIRYFNCKRCGAVGQYGKCEYCGSAE